LRFVSITAVPGLWLEFQRAARKRDPGVVDQNVHRSERTFDLFQRGLQRGTVSHVETERQRGNTECA
jgi:hypothetical protein